MGLRSSLLLPATQPIIAFECEVQVVKQFQGRCVVDREDTGLFFAAIHQVDADRKRPAEELLDGGVGKLHELHGEDTAGTDPLRRR
jgi:hypothetical protein